MRLLVFLLASSMLFAQLESNTVTVTATRSVALQRDQVVFIVSVITPAATSLDDVTAALQGSGITAGQLVDVANPLALVITASAPPAPRLLQWGFSVSVPVAKFKDTAAMLTALQKTIVQRANGFQLSYAVNGVMASQQSAGASLCPVADLIGDARTHAQKLAVGSGLTLGPIVGLSSVSSTATPTAVAAFIGLVPAQRSGDFSSLLPGNIISIPGIYDPYASFLLGGVLSVPSTVQPLACSLAVKFAATRY